MHETKISKLNSEWSVVNRECVDLVNSYNF